MENLKKQTVYLEVNKDLDIAVCHFNGDEWSHHVTVQSKEGYFFTPEKLNEYTANVIRQALETAVEKAEIEDIGNLGRDGEYHECIIVNEKSITKDILETDKIVNKKKMKIFYLLDKGMGWDNLVALGTNRMKCIEDYTDGEVICNTEEEVDDFLNQNKSLYIDYTILKD